MVICNKINCTGCFACFAVCPEHCIEMKTDEEGFLRPVINENICINCGLCKQVCPNTNILKNSHKECYVAVNKNLQITRSSSSGGAFSAIVNAVCKENYSIFGASFDEHWQVKHICLQDISKLQLLRGSKYVQSDLSDIFNKVKKFLKIGIFVLFSGTPCQIAGLRNYLKNDYDNLLCVDLVCHGVSSPVVFERYKDYLEKKYSSKITCINFAYKRYGWKDKRIYIRFKNGKTHEKLSITYDDEYMTAFLQHYILRPSCYHCQFATVERCSDITLADCWGVEHNTPQVNPRNGVSLILVNTEKGKKAIIQSEKFMTLFNANIDDYKPFNPQLMKPPNLPGNRDEAIKIAVSKDNEFKYFVNTYLKLRPLYKRKLSELKYIMKAFSQKYFMDAKNLTVTAENVSKNQSRR